MILDKTRQISGRTILLEVVGLILIVIGFILVLNNINSGPLKEFVFGNADMLTLPLVHQSLMLGEPFQWIFSSQIFLFPEALIYGISSLFGNNFKLALIINSFIAIILLYFAMRYVMRSFSNNKLVNISFSIMYITLVLLLQASEPRSDMSIAMYYFVTTAYYGVILSGLVAIGILSSVIKQENNKTLSAKSKILLGCLGCLSFLVGLSNPLFFLQVSAPLAIVLFIQRLFDFITTKLLIIVGSIIIGSLLTATLVRKVILSQFFSPTGNISNYFHFEDINLAIKTFYHMLLQMAHGTASQKIELSILVVLTLFSVSAFVYIVIMKIKKSKGWASKIQAHHFLLMAFAAVAPVTTTMGSILTGNAVMRYMMPILFFAPLAIIPLYVYIARAHLFLVKISVAAVAAILLIAILILARSPITITRELVTYYPTAAACMDNHLSGTEYKNGIAQYWRARVLQLNSKDGHIIEQTDATLKRFTWLYNKASYDMYDLSFVIVDRREKMISKEISNNPYFAIEGSSANYALGAPNNLYECEDFDIYAYDKGSHGHTVLNRTVRDRSMGR